MADWMLVLLPLLALPIVLLFRFLGCTHFTEAPSAPTEAPPDFEISLAVSDVSVNQGEKRIVGVTVTSKNGFNAATGLTTSPLPDLTMTFSPNPVTPPKDDKVTSNLTLEAASSAVAGAPQVTVTGTATSPSGTLVHSAVLNLNIIPVTPVPVTPDFSLSLSPPTVPVVRGQTATFTVNIARVGGFSGPVTLSISPATGNFSPNPASGNVATWAYPVPAATPPGNYPFAVTGTSGALSHTANGTLVVTT